MITILVPAHNEAASLPATIASLRAQTVQPNRVLVVSDNSTDDTVAVAESLGVDVMETVDNTARKAGALNQALATLPRDGYVLAMDADTVLVPDWIEHALAELADPDVGGVGAVFEAGPEATGWLGLCQRLEWLRYAEEIHRTGRTFVLSGTAALIRWEALESVRARYGRWYNVQSITEDMEIGIALKQCGWQLRSPVACRVVTETMPTVADLFHQRRRWSRGAIENIRIHGFNRVTAMYVRQQAMLALSITLLWALIGLTAAAFITHGPAVPQPFWLAVGAIFVTERVITIWDQPLRYRLFAALIAPELVYSIVLQVAHVAAIWQLLRKQEGVWTHVQPATV